MVFCIASKTVLIFIGNSEELQYISFIFNKYCAISNGSLFFLYVTVRREKGNTWDIFVKLKNSGA